MNAFAALGDDTRREIVKLVAINGELTATEISENFEISPPAISQHLKVLREAKILRMNKQAQRRLYSLDQEGFDELEVWLKDLKQLWEKRFNSLDKYLVKMKKERSNGKK